MKKQVITITKAILSALNAEGGMAMLSLLFWGGLTLFGAVNLVVSPYTSDIGMFAGLASIHPKLSIISLIIGIPSVLMFGMFTYMGGIMEMMYTYRRVMTTCTVYDSTGESITITTTHKKGVLSRMKHIIKNILSVVVVVVVSGCGDGDHAFRSERLMKQNYPTHCQRDLNGDGWYTLIEGAEALYGELGPCPTCTRIGVVPVYMVGTDATPDDQHQVWRHFKPSTLDTLEQRLEQKRQRIKEVPVEQTYKGASMIEPALLLFMLIIGIPAILAFLLVWFGNPFEELTYQHGRSCNYGGSGEYFGSRRKLMWKGSLIIAWDTERNIPAQKTTWVDSKHYGDSIWGPAYMLRIGNLVYGGKLGGANGFNQHMDFSDYIVKPVCGKLVRLVLHAR